MDRTHGFTLVELTFALLLGTLLLGIALPGFNHARDALAVRAARDRLLQAVALARSVAPLHAGAELVLEPPLARVTVRSGGLLHDRLLLGEQFGVTLAVQGSAQPSVELRFDALGIGRVANRTVVLNRGRARAGVTLSMYGRSRPW